MIEIRATVRLQFHRGFTLHDAVPLVAYFARLGISHIYASPILKARAGSMHGYDVVDPTCINPELGGEPALLALAAELRNHNMGLFVDFVPNHMAVGGDTNPWWLDVLEWGGKSRYAQFFDIQWNSHDPLLKGQLLVPFLRTDYGEVLAAGEITLNIDKANGSFYAQHFDHRFPIYPPTYNEILQHSGDQHLVELGSRFQALDKSVDNLTDTYSLQQELKQTIASEAQAKALDVALSRFNTAPAEGMCADENIQTLHKLLELQHYRLASWRTAADDINWRRFFDVNELGALRAERAEVFEAIHEKLFELVEKGLIDGVRIDHIDGLANPRAYCRKLRRRLDRLSTRRPAGFTGDHIPIYVEKILGDGEQLSSSWNVDGTTGYEFMNQVSLLQHDPLGELHLYALWGEISKRKKNFKEEVREARQLVLSTSLAGDVEMVAQGLLLVARTDIATRDFTLGAIRRALMELIIHFPVYRTYVRACGRSAQDQHFFSEAMTGARTTLAEADWPLLEHLDRWLGGRPIHELPPGPVRKLWQKALTRFQQLTSPAAAKAVEDTACYRSAVLLSRNDVGFDPYRFSAPLALFHQACRERIQQFPHNLLATATHDHKRGEDTRARLAVVSERSVWFDTKIRYWQNLAAPLRTELDDGVAPSPGDELMLYQILLASWPLELKPQDEAGVQTYLERLLRWQEKAMREAKLRTNWSTPNTAYETACKDFLTKLLRDDQASELRNDVAAAAAAIAPAGALNSLGQSLLRMTTPGIPDLYQGNEFWDFSLVDPDNRQPVDFEARTAAIGTTTEPASLIKHWQDGHIKQWLITKTLGARMDHFTLFDAGGYQELDVTGPQADRVVAFIRQHRNEYALIIVPRLCATLLGDYPAPQVPPETWADTCIVLPAVLGKSVFSSIFSTNSYPAQQGHLAVGELLNQFPVNLLYTLGADSALP